MPSRNEADRIGSLLAELRERLPGVSILVVDDSSSDATVDVATAAGARGGRWIKPARASVGRLAAREFGFAGAVLEQGCGAVLHVVGLEEWRRC